MTASKRRIGLASLAEMVLRRNPGMTDAPVALEVDARDVAAAAGGR